jgi:IclR family transcriptional regulator, acetate operon repressor
VGGRMPAHATGVGKAILAFADDAVVDGVVAAGLPRVSLRTITSPAILRRQLQRIRDEGVAYEREESGTGTVCVACPILDADGAPVAAISVAGWSNRMRPERVGPAVRAAALTLSRVAGARD